MRKVTRQTAQAFIDGRPKFNGNTHTDGTALFLHGNKIAEKRDNGIYATLAGWPTVTTRERLNGLCDLLDIAGRFYQHKHRQYFGNAPSGNRAYTIDSDEWVQLTSTQGFQP